MFLKTQSWHSPGETGEINTSPLIYFETDVAGILDKRATAVLTYAVDSLLRIEVYNVVKLVISSAILSLVLKLTYLFQLITTVAV